MKAPRRFYLRALFLVAVVGVLVALSACLTLDLNEPVAFAPDGLSGSEIEVLTQAAECWNRGFGTDFRVVDSAPDISQVVEVFHDDLTCLNAKAEYQLVPRAVSICLEAFSLSSSHEALLFDVLLHELGHVANIFGHSGDDGVVSKVGVRLAGAVLFTPTDRRRFAEENPGFTAIRECDLIRTESDGTEPSAPACACP